MRRGRRPACGCAPRGCGSVTRSRRDLHEVEGERGGRGALPPCSSARTRRRTRACPPPTSRSTSMPARACPTTLPPDGPVGAPDPCVSVRARNYFTGTQRLAGLRPSSQRHRAPVPQPNHAHEDYSPSRSRCQVAHPPPPLADTSPHMRTVARGQMVTGGGPYSPRCARYKLVVIRV